MIDNKYNIYHIHEFENVIYYMKLKGIVVLETVLVEFYDFKLLPSWSFCA